MVSFFSNNIGIEWLFQVYEIHNKCVKHEIHSALHLFSTSIICQLLSSTGEKKVGQTTFWWYTQKKTATTAKQQRSNIKRSKISVYKMRYHNLWKKNDYYATIYDDKNSLEKHSLNSANRYCWGWCVKKGGQRQINHIWWKINNSWNFLTEVDSSRQLRIETIHTQKTSCTMYFFFCSILFKLFMASFVF